MLGLLVLAVLVGRCFGKVGINDIDFQALAARRRQAPDGHRRPRPRRAGARALRRGIARLAVGPGGDADGDDVVGVFIGAIAGMARGWIDAALMDRPLLSLPSCRCCCC